jgi:hypothetical protein
VPNMDVAKAIINAVNAKMHGGAGNLKSGPWDRCELSNPKLATDRAALLHAQAHSPVPVPNTAQGRTNFSGAYIHGDPGFTVGNCGERCYYGLYLLKNHLINLGGAPPPVGYVLTGDSTTSINHDFIVLGAGNVPPSANYSVTQIPPWTGADVVICDPWYQDGVFSYEHGVAYPLNKWGEMLPKIIDKARRKTGQFLNVFQFNLTLSGA